MAKRGVARHVRRHEHWRVTNLLPMDGAPCPVPTCNALCEYPPGAYETAPGDDRDAQQVMEDARTFMEIVSLFCLVDLSRQGQGGISAQEAHRERERLFRLREAQRVIRAR